MGDEAKKLRPSDWEKPKLPKLRERETIAAEQAVAPPKKNKGPKGPNPMSCLKKKRKAVDTANIAAEGCLGNEVSSVPAVPNPRKKVRSRRARGTSKTLAESPC